MAPLCHNEHFNVARNEFLGEIKLLLYYKIITLIYFSRKFGFSQLVVLTCLLYLSSALCVSNTRYRLRYFASLLVVFSRCLDGYLLIVSDHNLVSFTRSSYSSSLLVIFTCCFFYMSSLRDVFIRCLFSSSSLVILTHFLCGPYFLFVFYRRIDCY